MRLHDLIDTFGSAAVGIAAMAVVAGLVFVALLIAGLM